MNRIFRVVWNRALGQLVVVSELCRSKAKGGRTGARGRTLGSLTPVLQYMALGVMLALGGLPAANAHTISIGYANTGESALTFWYGTYHTTSETTYNEGSLQLVGPGINTTLPFNLLTSTKPTGLVDGQTNFFNDGGVLGPINEAGLGDVLNWQGIQFTGLTPGTYTFTYIPIANPTAVWAPEDSVILSNSVTVITADLSTAPRVGTGEVVDQTTAGDPLIFDGGTLRPTGDATLNQVVSVAGGGGTIDTNGNDLTLTGDIDGRADLTKTGDGTLSIQGTNTNAGDLAIDGGTVNVTSDSNLGAGGVIIGAGTLQAGDSFSTDNPITLTDGQSTIDTQSNQLTVTGVIDGTGTLNKIGTGALELTGANTYTGGTIIDDGKLSLAGNGSIASSSGVDVAGSGTFDISGHNGDADVQSLDGTGAVDLGNNGLNLTNASGNFGGTIGGAGGVTVSGGSETLSGSNTYTGVTTIDSGATLALDGDGSVASSSDVIDNGTFDISGHNGDADVQSLDGTGAVDLGNNGLNLTNASGNFGGTIGGAGGVTVSGGSETLSGSNTYTGGTTISGGTLQISSDANVGAADGGLLLAGGTLHTTGNIDMDRQITMEGGAFDIGAGTTMTNDGNVDGADGLVKNGQGTLVINGVASHHGGTTVNDGTLVLNGNNTYTGGTTLNGGTLQISGDANLGDASGSLNFNGGDLTVTQSMTTSRDIVIGEGNASITALDGVTLTAQGDLSGTGGLVKRGDGTLVVSGTNTYTGGTLIDGGVIKIDSGSSLGTGTIVLQGGTLQTVETLGTGQTVLVSGDSGVNTDAGTTTELSGQILADGSAGCFVKSGAGTLNMTGSATLANGTCVEEGTLRANGALTSWVQVDHPGALRGTGVIHGAVNVDGLLAPGNSPGTLTVTGPVTMNAGGTLQIDIDGYGTGTGAGNYSRLVLTGANGVFTAGGTLAPTLRGIAGGATNHFTPKLGDMFTIVRAEGGVTGHFDKLQQPTDGLAANTRFQVFYMGGHAIDLFVTPTSYAKMLAGEANGNSLRMGAAIDQIVAAQDAGAQTSTQRDLLLTLAGARAEMLPGIVHALSGEAHAQEATMAREVGLGLTGDMIEHLGEASVDDGDHGRRAWATVGESGYRVSADEDADRFRSQQHRASVGLDAWHGDVGLWGVGLAHTESSLQNTPASGSVRGNAVLFYGQMKVGAALLDGTASWSKDNWNAQRPDAFVAGASLSSKVSGYSGAASVAARFPMDVDGLHVEPYTQMIWQRISRDAFTEAGDALSQLDVAGYVGTGSRFLAGVKLGSLVQDPLSTRVTYRLGVALGHDFGDVLDPQVTTTLAGASAVARAPAMGHDVIKVDASGTLRLGKQAYLYGGLTSETGQGRASYGVNAGVRVQF